MKTAFRVTTSAVLLLVWANLAAAQTADEIIEKNLTAAGGRTAIAAVKSRVMTGAITLSTPVGDLAGTIEVYAKAPNKTRTLVKVDLTTLGGGTVINDQRFDGTSGYVIDSLNGNRDITGDQLEAMRNNVFPTPLLVLKERGFTTMLSGEDTVGGKPVSVITLTPKTGPSTRIFVERESSLVVKTSTTLTVPQLGGAIEQVTELSDYRDVDGLKIPFVIRTVNPIQTIVTRISSVTHNVDVDDGMFIKPPSQ